MIKAWLCYEWEGDEEPTIKFKEPEDWQFVKLVEIAYVVLKNKE